MTRLDVVPGRVDIRATSDQPLTFTLRRVDGAGDPVDWAGTIAATLLRRPRRGGSAENVLRVGTVTVVDDEAAVSFPAAAINQLVSAAGAWTFTVDGTTWLDGTVSVLPRGTAGGTPTTGVITVTVGSETVVVTAVGSGGGTTLTVADLPGPTSPNDNVYAFLAPPLGYDDDPTLRGFVREFGSSPERNPIYIEAGALSVPPDHQIMIASRSASAEVDLSTLTAGVWTEVEFLRERLTEFGPWQNRSQRVLATKASAGHSCYVAGGVGAHDVAVCTVLAWDIDWDPPSSATIIAALPSGERWPRRPPGSSTAITPRSDAGSWDVNTRSETLLMPPGSDMRLDRLTFVRRPTGATGTLTIDAWTEVEGGTY